LLAASILVSNATAAVLKASSAVGVTHGPTTITSTFAFPLANL